MRFNLIDKITELQPGVAVKAVKCLSLAEEYLSDHFPLFPVMPGVLMLEAMYQGSSWLLRCTDEFAYSMVVMSEAKNVKYADFVRPGQTLEITAEIQKRENHATTLKAAGTLDGATAVSGRLTLEHYNLADRDDSFAEWPKLRLNIS